MAEDWRPERLQAALEKLSLNGDFDGTDAHFTNEQLSRIAAAAPIVNGRHHFSSATFKRAQFDDDACFEALDFGRAVFANASFGDRTSVRGVTFGDDADFANARFGADAAFEDVTFGDRATLAGARFGARARLGALEAAGGFDLTGAAFEELARIKVAARSLKAADMVLRGGTTLEVARASMDLSGTVFDQPVTVRSASAPDGDDDQLPRLLSLAGANVSKLTLTDMDLRGCRFAGVQSLDGIRLDGDTRFERAPGRLGVHGRRAIAEEHAWRAGRKRDWGWRRPEVGCEADPAAGAVGPGRIAILYRALRKGREDAKDGPGAADFYYGEMETRRHSAASWTDRQVLRAYWAVSGYGLRTSRALVTLMLTIGVFAPLFWAVGFKSHPAWSLGGFATALAASLQSATSLVRPPATDLSPAGTMLDAALRFLGTALLGLAVYSLRGRIQR